jgi:hypothetical protein
MVKAGCNSMEEFGQGRKVDVMTGISLLVKNNEVTGGK